MAGPWRFASGFAVVFALLITIAVLGVVQDGRAAASRAYVAQAHAAQATALELEALSAEMELHQRGYLVTGDAALLAARDAIHAEGVARGRALVERVAPAQRGLARAVNAAFGQRHARMREVVAIADRDGLEAARAIFRVHGATSLDPVLHAVRALRQAQAVALAAQAAEAERSADHFRRLLVYGTALALLMLATTAWLLLRQLWRNARLQQALEDSHRKVLADAKELARSNRELESFSYTISHDLRAPLRHIDGYARIVQEDVGDRLGPDVRRQLDTISASARRMGMLIDDLLAFSRMGRKPIEPVRVDMAELTGATLAEAGVGDAEVRIGELPCAWADPVLMRQAWVNLLSNAVKYSAPRGDAARIEIEGDRAPGVTRFTIRDNGVGFDMRYADKLFGVFQRLHPQDEFEGTGVGLAIVQRIVERHGGRVYAEAAPGQGACFTIELPAEEVAA